MMPPTLASHSRCSISASPATSIAWNPTRRSWPRSAASGAMRAGSGGVNVRHALKQAASPSARSAPQAGRLPTSGGDQPPHALGILGLADTAVALDERADDHAFGHGEELGHAVGGDTAADEHGHHGHRAAHALHVADGRGVTRRLAGDDEGVGQASMHEIARLLLELDGRHRRRMLALDVGEDLDVGAEEPAVTQRVIGLGLHDALVGHDGAGVDVDADELGAGRGGNGQRGARVVLQHVDADGHAGQGAADGGHEDGHGRDGAGLDVARRERRVPVVLDEQGVHAALDEDGGVGHRGHGRALHRAVPAGAAGQRRQVNHADERASQAHAGSEIVTRGVVRYSGAQSMPRARIFYGWWVTLAFAAMVFTATIYGRFSVGSVFGTMFLVHQTGAALGSWLGGALFEATGGYGAAFAVASGALVVAAIVTMTLDERARCVAPQLSPIAGGA